MSLLSLIFLNNLVRDVIVETQKIEYDLPSVASHTRFLRCFF